MMISGVTSIYFCRGDVRGFTLRKRDIMNELAIVLSVTYFLCFSNSSGQKVKTCSVTKPGSV